jgi:hypothetical protein
VGGHAGDLAIQLGDPFVLKPIGPGNFSDDDGAQNVVFVREVSVEELKSVDMLEAPFLAQRVIRAISHLRVVTVGEHTWVAELTAIGLPMDWRAHDPAHRSFRVTSKWPEVENSAMQLAASLRSGFTCQDWIVDNEGPAFLDLNPGGQWLFLPDEIAVPVAAELARWLEEST